MVGGSWYFDYARQTWVQQMPGDREIVRVDAHGNTHYADGDVEGPNCDCPNAPIAHLSNCYHARGQ